MRQISKLACLVSLASAAPQATAQARLIGIDTSGSTLYDVDPATGARTAVGAVTGGTSTVGALAYDEAGDILYLSSTGNDSLFRLDPNTLVATLIGPFNIGSTVVMHGIEHVPSTGRLYGKSTNAAGGGDFFEIDKLTGQATVIGTTGVAGFGGLSYIGGTMYLSDTVGDQLMTVDLTTGVATPVGTFGVVGSVGIGFAYNAAYGLLASDNVTDSLYSVDIVSGLATLIGPFGSSNMISLEFISQGFGTPYCPGVMNSTGLSGVLSAAGSAVALDNNVILSASDLPPNAFGFFLTSMTQGFVANPGGSQGNLCLGGSIGRYVGAGQIQNSGAQGQFSLALNLNQHPTPIGFVQVSAGETWNFQAWYRDAVGGAAVSNFTSGLEVAFL